MTSKAQNIIDVINRVYSNLGRPLLIVECGTIRRLEPDFEEGDGHSTRYIAEWIVEKEPGSLFYSCDLIISEAIKALNALDLSKYVNLIKCPSVEFLEAVESKIDFCYLDTFDDPDNCLQEFLIAWPKITKGGALMADDCSLEVKECVKGDKLIPYLIENNIQFEYKENRIFGKTQIVLWK